uniref:Uncharacterized protein n=1 Tax=Avena sativa TaxID=4498 RepID=A0ACD5YBM0_AVESA
MDAARPRLSPPADRFLDLFSSPSPSPSLYSSPSASDELLEGDLLFPAPSSDPPPHASNSKNPGRVPHGHLGLLAALHDGDRKLLGRAGRGGSAAAATATAATAGTLLRRKATIAAAAAAAASSTPSLSPQSSTRAIPAAPRPRNPELAPLAPYHQSAPVKVPVRPPPRRHGWDELDGQQDKEEENLVRGDAAMLPPHEMVARASIGGSFGGGAAVNPSSMLEGAGRTLKGRDLRRVRDAVFRQTGFLD